MIDLFSIKKYNTYDFVQHTKPSGTGTWLVDETFTDGAVYTKGYSYDVVSGVATRIEVSEDERINANLHPTIKMIMDFLNNYFYVKRQDFDELTINTGSWAIPTSLLDDIIKFFSDVSEYNFKADGEIDNLQNEIFIVGDLIRIAGSLRNDIVGYVESLSPLKISNKALRITTENAGLFLSNIPLQVEEVISQMIHYDIFKRKNKDKKRERIGNYSYEIDTDSYIKLGGLQYPNYWNSILNKYKKVKLVQ